LYSTLLTNYNVDTRPIDDQSKAIYVNISLLLISINDFDEVAGTLSITALLQEVWYDELLRWNPATYGGAWKMILTQKKIWLPELYNVKVAEEFKPISNDKFKLTAFAHGLVFWMPGGLLSVKCSPDISMFPFDAQTCKIWLTPWGYTSAEVQLITIKDIIDMTYYETNGEWSVLSSKSYAFTVDESPFVGFDLKIKRLPIYHIMNTLLPIAILILLNPMVFILPCESGERSGYSLTMLLSFTVFMTVVSDSLPPTSDPMSTLSYIVFGTLVTSGMISAINIFQLRLFFKEESALVPSWLANILRCCSSSKLHGSKVKPLTSQDENEDIEKIEPKLTWQEAVKVLDFIFALLFYIIIITSMVSSFVYIAVS